MTNSNRLYSKRPSLKGILKLAGKIGISAGRALLFVLLTFGITNFLLVIYAVIQLFTVDFSWANAGIFLLVLSLAAGFTILACYLTYRYIVLLSLRKVYDMTLEQRTKISENIIQRIEGLFNGAHVPSQAQLNQAVDWSKTVYRYYQSVPVFFQSGITQYLNRIPITNYIIAVKEDIITGNHHVAAAKLRLSIDEFFEAHIIGSPSNVWTWLLFPVDIIVLYSLITT